MFSTAKSFIKKSGIFNQNSVLDEVQSMPAMLFENRTNNAVWGQVFLFEKFGNVKNCELINTSQITNHYVEENVTISDHWAIEPTRYRLSGAIGQVLYTPPKKSQSLIKKYVPSVLKKLGVISPTLNNTIQGVISHAKHLEDNVKHYASIAAKVWDKLANGGGQDTNMTIIYNSLATLVDNRQLVTVWTPWGEVGPMAITSIIVTNDPTTKFISNIEVELQKWNSVQSLERDASQNEKDALASSMESSTSEQGTASSSSQELQPSIAKNAVDNGMDWGKVMAYGFGAK
jgi:hypothetical protein